MEGAVLILWTIIAELIFFNGITICIFFKGVTDLCIWSSNQSEFLNRHFRYYGYICFQLSSIEHERGITKRMFYRLFMNYEEIPMDVAFHHFRDMQRVVLTECAR